LVLEFEVGTSIPTTVVDNNRKIGTKRATESCGPRGLFVCAANWLALFLSSDSFLASWMQTCVRTNLNKLYPGRTLNNNGASVEVGVLRFIKSSEGEFHVESHQSTICSQRRALSMF